MKYALSARGFPSRGIGLTGRRARSSPPVKRNLCRGRRLIQFMVVVDLVYQIREMPRGLFGVQDDVIEGKMWHSLGRDESGE